VQKLTNRDIERIVKQWQKKRPIYKIANYFGVSRQWIHRLINRYTQSRSIPVIHRPGQKSKDIHEETRFLILDSYHDYRIGPVHLEKKIEEVHGLHIPHNTIYRVLLGSWVHRTEYEKKKAEKVGPIRAGAFHVTLAG